jgi:hypothetical protein
MKLDVDRIKFSKFHKSCSTLQTLQPSILVKKFGAWEDSFWSISILVQFEIQTPFFIIGSGPTGQPTHYHSHCHRVPCTA